MINQPTNNQQQLTNKPNQTKPNQGRADMPVQNQTITSSDLPKQLLMTYSSLQQQSNGWAAGQQNQWLSGLLDLVRPLIAVRCR
jgi:hypothetical protein